LLQCVKSRLALSGHSNGAERCLLSEVKQTWPKDGVMSAYDPQRHMRANFAVTHNAALW